MNELKWGWWCRNWRHIRIGWVSTYRFIWLHCYDCQLCRNILLSIQSKILIVRGRSYQLLYEGVSYPCIENHAKIKRRGTCVALENDARRWCVRRPCKCRKNACVLTRRERDRRRKIIYVSCVIYMYVSGVYKT